MSKSKSNQKGFAIKKIENHTIGLVKTFKLIYSTKTNSFRFKKINLEMFLGNIILVTYFFYIRISKFNF